MENIIVEEGGSIKVLLFSEVFEALMETINLKVNVEFGKRSKIRVYCL